MGRPLRKRLRKRQMTPVAIAILCAILLGSAAGSGAGQNGGKPASIEGLVTNSSTGAGLADVRITAVSVENARESRTATTDSDGRFVIASLPPGRYSVTAARTLFFNPRKSAQALPLSLAAGQALRGVTIPLLPTGVISGRVLDENRQAVRSVRMEALRREYRSGVPAWIVSAQNTTDDRGEYRLFNLQPGTYLVRATPSSASSGSGVYYPNVFEAGAAVPIAIAPGTESGGTDLVLRKNGEYDVRLQLPALPDDSAAAFYILRRNGTLNESLTARPESLPDKVFRLTKLPPGAYDLFVTATATIDLQRAVTHTARIPLDVDSRNVDLGTVDLRPNVVVSGRFIAAEGLAVPVDPTKLVLTLRPVETPTVLSAAARGGTPPRGIAADGTFAVSAAAGARFDIAVSGLPADAYLIAARIDGRDILDTGLDMSNRPDRVELLVGGASSVGSVSGTVRDARGVPSAFASVVLVPTPERRSNPSAFKTATTDQDGGFAIQAVLPGDYKVFAWEDLEPGIYQNAQFLKEVETRGERVKVERGAASAVSARIISMP